MTFGVIAGLALMGRGVLAQCPDGSPRPCAPARLAPPDRNVIAVMPFRVSGADPSLSILRDGLAELVAAEFNGDGAPRAIEPGETLRAWSRAGGRNAFLSQAQTLRLAHELGAGQVLVGAVVGTPRRVTISASIMNVPRGDVRVPAVIVETTPDSLATLVANLSARLLGRAVGAWRLSAHDPGTTSNEAVRAYLLGQQHRYGGSSQRAAGEYSRALSLDSTFVLAAYWNTLMRRLQNGFPQTPNDDANFRLAWKYRDRLGPQQRLLLEAALGPNGPEGNDGRGDITLAVERAMLQAPTSAEGWNLLGDRFFHDGALMGRDDWVAVSKRAFEKALLLDTAAAIHGHGVQLAFYDRDAAMLKRFLGAMRRDTAAPRELAWSEYLAAILDRNPVAVSASRERFARTANCDTPGPGPFGCGIPFIAAGTRLPTREADLLINRILSLAPTPQARTVLLRQVGEVAANAGRPSKAVAAWRESFAADSLRRELHVLRFAENDSVAAEQVNRLLHTVPDTAGEMALMRCEVTLSRLRRGDTTDLAASLARVRTSRPGPPALRPRNFCADIAEAIAASLRPTDSLHALRRVDSILRTVPPATSVAGISPLWNYDVAVAFSARGEWRMAAGAARRRLWGVNSRLAVSLRDEGRWALLAGDTANAIAAFRQYLELRDDPEPVVVPERDSIRAQLARITPARRVTNSGTSND